MFLRFLKIYHNLTKKTLLQFLLNFFPRLFSVSDPMLKNIDIYWHSLNGDCSCKKEVLCLFHCCNYHDFLSLNCTLGFLSCPFSLEDRFESPRASCLVIRDLAWLLWDGIFVLVVKKLSCGNRLLFWSGIVLLIFFFGL